MWESIAVSASLDFLDPSGLQEFQQLSSFAPHMCARDVHSSWSFPDWL